MTVRVEVEGHSGLHHVVNDERGPLDPVNAFLRALTTRGLSPLTVRAYAYDLVAVYRGLAATDRELGELTQADLLDFIAHERRREARPRSINRRLTVCRLLVEFWHPAGIADAGQMSLPAPHYRGPGRDRRLGLHLRRRHGPLRAAPAGDPAPHGPRQPRDDPAIRQPVDGRHRPGLPRGGRADPDPLRVGLTHEQQDEYSSKAAVTIDRPYTSTPATARCFFHLLSRFLNSASMRTPRLSSAKRTDRTETPEMSERDTAPHCGHRVRGG